MICSALPLRIESDADQLVAGQQPGSLRRGTLLDAFGDDAVFGVDPFNAIPGRRFVVERAGGS